MINSKSGHCGDGGRTSALSLRQLIETEGCVARLPTADRPGALEAELGALGIQRASYGYAPVRTLRDVWPRGEGPSVVQTPRFRVQDLEHIVAYPSVTHAGTNPYFLHDARGPEPTQKIVGTGLADIEALLHVPDGQDRVSEQHVHHEVSAAPATQTRSVSLAQVR